MTKTPFTTPVMRLVQGSVDEPQTKDQQGRPRVVQSGPNAGQPNPQYFIAGAIPKNDPAWPAFWALIVNQAVTDFPHLFPQGAAPLIAAGGPDPYGGPPAGSSTVRAFAFKVLDGDGFDTNGKANGTKEGFAGHWVVRFASGFPPRCFHAGRYAAQEQIQEKNAIRRGYYIRVNGTLEGNGNAQKPGLYMNISLVELSGYGPEIVSGPDAAEAFGATPAALPPGATAMPQAAGAPPAYPQQAPTAAPPAYPQQAPTAAPPPASPPPPPYTAYMQQPAAAPPPAPAAAPAPAAGPVLTAKAGATTYAAFIAAGWTDETLRQHGYLA